MEVNVDKSKVMILSETDKPLLIIVGNQEVDNGDQFRHLRNLHKYRGRLPQGNDITYFHGHERFYQKEATFEKQFKLEKQIKCYVRSLRVKTWTLRKI